MSATTGIVACSAIVLSASASSQWGTATRTISHPAATRAAICWSVALTSAVFVVHIDWTRTGASPPTSTQPTLISRDARRRMLIANVSIPRSAPRLTRSLAEHVNDDLAIFGLIQLEQEEALPLPEQRLTRPDGNRVRSGAQDHLRDVRAAVRTLVPLLEVLGPPLQVVMGVVDVGWADCLQPPPKILERTVLQPAGADGTGSVG